MVIRLYLLRFRLSNAGWSAQRYMSDFCFYIYVSLAQKLDMCTVFLCISYNLYRLGNNAEIQIILLGQCVCAHDEQIICWDSE